MHVASINGLTSAAAPAGGRAEGAGPTGCADIVSDNPERFADNSGPPLTLPSSSSSWAGGAAGVLVGITRELALALGVHLSRHRSSRVGGCPNGPSGYVPYNGEWNQVHESGYCASYARTYQEHESA